MNHPLNRFRSLKILVAGVLSLVCSVQLSAQITPVPSTPDPSAADSSTADEEKTQSADPDLLSYREVDDQIRQNEKRISDLFSSIPLGFPAKQKEHLTQISALKLATAKLRSQRTGAALRSFRLAPMSDPLVTHAIFEMATRKLEPRSPESHFSPGEALELADMLLAEFSPDHPQTSVEPKTVAYLAFRSSYATEQFDRAGAYLKLIEDSGAAVAESTRPRLEQTAKQWERESEIRQLESKADDLPRVKFETSEGDFVVELFENEAPQTVGNFISLVEKNFYNDLKFFRVQPGIFSQTGCKNNNGTGDVGYRIPCECNAKNARSHFAGTLSMVNQRPDTASSQFVICHQPNAMRDGKNTAFGRVVEGLDVVYRLRTVQPDQSAKFGFHPSAITRATVIRKRDHPYSPNKINSGTIPSGVPSETPRNDSGNDKN